MTHIPFELALIRRDELLREAAVRRLQHEGSTERRSILTAIRRPRRPHRLRQLRFADR